MSTGKPLLHALRFVRHDLLPRWALRRAYPQARISERVKFSGDLSRCRLGDGVTILGPSVLYVTDGGGLTSSSLTVGDGTFIGEFANIRTAGQPISIGRTCLLSQHISIVGSHHGTAAGTPVVDQPWHGEGVQLGDDVWVGAGSTILSGARIGDGAIVAANSVVRGVVAPGDIVAGSPARVVGHRE